MISSKPLFGIETIVVKEPVKTYENALFVIEQLIEKGCDRDTVLVGCGGGSVTDLTGFVGSIFLRGISVILIPTTLLAMVDASIGGKNSIDTPFGKNLIGTFYLPENIIIDTAFLDTLPQKEWNHGMAEILKLGLVYDKELLLPASPLDLITKAVHGKLAITSVDFKDTHLRRILNFGHTIGHALETGSGYAIPHGEAVALGCMTEAFFSYKLGYLDPLSFEKILSLYTSWKLPSTYCREKTMAALQKDKKNKGGNIRSVLIDAIGHALAFNKEYCHPLPNTLILEGLSWLEKQ
jgi:3-dehydroquinate synthase